MRALIVFATTEGHTRELCQFAATRLREAGRTVAVEEASPAADQATVAAYDVVFLAGSLHVSRFQAAITHFAAAHREILAARPCAFISVSLAAAGEALADWDGLDACMARFEHETGWTPHAVHHAAGAIRFGQYDFFKRLAIKHIAARRGHAAPSPHAYDLTDYDALTRFVLGFAEGAAAAR